jgi:hypothetical protein
MPLIAFTLAWILAIYLFNAAVARNFKKIELEGALVYISSVTLLGVFGEVLIDSLYAMAFGVPLWEYRLLPIHHAFTSYYSLAIWSMYGFYLYLLHDTLNGRLRSTAAKASVIALEAIVLEILLNVSHLIIFGSYIFYYLPSDLWHVTTIQAVPVYFLAGFFIVRMTRSIKVDPRFFIAVNAVLVGIFVFLGNSA